MTEQFHEYLATYDELCLRLDGRVDPTELGAVARAFEAAGLKPGDGACWCFRWR